MNKKILMISMFVIIMVSACSLGPVQPDQGQPANAATQQALIEQAVRGTATTSAMLTQISEMETRIANPTAVSGETVIVQTVVVTNTPAADTPTPTQVLPTPTNTPVPPTATATLIPPTATQSPPTATATPSIPCNGAKFETDVTIPDGTVFSPGASFTKTWRLKNTGSCSWTTTYDLVFVGGSQLGGPAVVDMPGNVAPGQVIDLSVSFTAPVSAGSYRGNWKLRDASGILFGLGKTNVPFYVDIKVSTASATFPLDFAALYCSAEWSSGSNSLPCPGTDNDSRGFVLRIDRPVLESGYIDDEPVLLTNPQMITDSVIRGKYPAIRVENGYDFSAVIGCAYKATNCDVNFQLDYQIGNGSIVTLKTWHEVYEGKYTSVVVDLNSLAGKDVKFILTVFSNGPSNEDRAQWLAPRINK